MSRFININVPFLLKHPQYYKLLTEVYLKCKQKESQSRDLPSFRPIYYCENREPTWKDLVVKWWNDWIVNGFRHKTQLYLWGTSTIDKSLFVSDLLKLCIEHNDDFHDNNDPYDANDEDDDDDGGYGNDDDCFENAEKDNNVDDEFIESYIFRPTPNENDFAFQEWDRFKYNICIFNKFQESQFDLLDLKKAIAGKFFMTNCKYIQVRRVIKLQVPTIFISEFDAPIQPGFRERLMVVKVD